MKWEREGLLALLAAMKVRLMGVGAALALFAASLYLAQQHAQSRAAMESRLSQARHEVAAQSDAQMSKDVAARFAALRRDGVFDEDPRLALVETVQRCAERLHLAVDYELQPAAPTHFPLAPGEGEVTAHRMALRLSLTHEGELIALLDGLRASPGIFWPQRCLISRADAAPVGEENPAAELSAECDLVWLTLPPRAQGSPP